jgi:hypothetical protein
MSNALPAQGLRPRATRERETRPSDERTRPRRIRGQGHCRHGPRDQRRSDYRHFNRWTRLRDSIATGNIELEHLAKIAPVDLEVRRERQCEAAPLFGDDQVER